MKKRRGRRGQEYGFIVYKNTDNKGRTDLTIRFLPKDKDEDGDRWGNYDPDLEFSWYTDEDRGYWSGFDIVVPKVNNTERLNYHTNLVKRLLKDNGGYYYQPQHIIEQARACGFPQLFYDPRLVTNKFLPGEEILGEEYGSWKNANHRQIDFLIKVVARDEEEARTEIEKRFNKNAFYDQNKKTYAYEQWKANGRPVGRYYTLHGNLETRPNTTSAEEMVCLPDQRCEECNTPLTGNEIRYIRDLENHCLACYPDQYKVEQIKDFIRLGY